jgi:hypothetical protein
MLRMEWMPKQPIDYWPVNAELWRTLVHVSRFRSTYGGLHFAYSAAPYYSKGPYYSFQVPPSKQPFDTKMS